MIVTRKMSLFSLVAVNLVLAAGCGSAVTGPAVKRQMTVGFSPEQIAAKQAADDKAYLIRRGDVLMVRDLFNEVLNQEEVLVLPDGCASFFGLGPVRVAGLSVSAIEAVLTEEYGKEFRDPKLSVAVRQLGSHEIFVLGEVRQPGKYDLPNGGFSMFAAIAAAGGFEKGADRGSIVLLRVTEQGYVCREIDLSNFASARSFDPTVVDVQPSDVLYVSRSVIGDFVAFTNTVVTSLLSYAGLAVDVKYISDGDTFRR